MPMQSSKVVVCKRASTLFVPHAASDQFAVRWNSQYCCMSADGHAVRATTPLCVAPAATTKDLQHHACCLHASFKLIHGRKSNVFRLSACLSLTAGTSASAAAAADTRAAVMSVPGPGTDYSGGFSRNSGTFGRASSSGGGDYDDLYQVHLLHVCSVKLRCSVWWPVLQGHLTQPGRYLMSNLNAMRICCS